MCYLVCEDLMFCFDELCCIYGLLVGCNCIIYDEFVFIMYFDDWQEVIEIVNVVVVMGGIICVEYCICCQDMGEVCYFFGIGKLVWVDGIFIEYVGMVIDIIVWWQVEYVICVVQVDMECVLCVNIVGQLIVFIVYEINQLLMFIVFNVGVSLCWLNWFVFELEYVCVGLCDIISEGQCVGGIISSLQNLICNCVL